MATTLSTASRNVACDAVVDSVDAGAGAGKFRIKDGGGTVIAEVACADPAFGSASTGAAALAGTPRAGAGIAAAGSGTNAATFDLTDSNNNVVLSGAVGNGSGELSLNNINIANGQVVNIASFTYTQPA